MDTTFATDHTKRVVLDVNQVISPTLAIRAGGLFQDASVAGRNYSKDDRDGGFVAVKWTPLDTVKLWANYIHTNLHGMPDFGVPYYRPGTPAPATGFTTTAGGPFTDFGVNRNTFYGLVNRDYYSIKQDIGTVGGEITITPDLTLSSKTRVQRSVQDYIGTLPEGADHGDRQCQSAMDAQPQSAEPLPGQRKRRQRDRSSLEDPARRLEEHVGRRRRILARAFQHRQICRPQFGSAPGWNDGWKYLARKYLQSWSSRLRLSPATRSGRVCRPGSRSIPRAVI